MDAKSAASDLANSTQRDMERDTIPEEVAIQRSRYSEIADQYDGLHVDQEHVIALSFLHGMLSHLQPESILDVGAGTGRAMTFLRDRFPGLRIMGIEPVEGLRQAGYRKGIPSTDLIDGDGYDIRFADLEFDVVCEVGVLHHVRRPNQVVSEMLRVARKAVFISDNNNFGGGSLPARLAKQCFHCVGLWGVVNYLKTAGKGYSITKGDGLFYSYSVFDSLPVIRRACRSVYVLNTSGPGTNHYRNASHVAVLGVK